MPLKNGTNAIHLLISSYRYISPFKGLRFLYNILRSPLFCFPGKFTDMWVRSIGPFQQVQKSL